jgi:hypothetical protein
MEYIMAKTNKTLASLIASPTPVAVAVPGSTESESVTVSLTDLRAMLEDSAKAGAEAILARLGKAPSPAPAPAAKPAKAPVGDEALLANAKRDACFKAAKAACKAAGLAWNGVKGEGSKGGKFENPAAYWAVYWAGFNAKATELGIPTQTK